MKLPFFSPKKPLSVEERLQSMQGSTLLSLVFLSTLVFGFGAWSVKTMITGAVIASGTVGIESNEYTVQHVDGGAVAEIFVRNGDTVEESALLARLDSSNIESEIILVESLLIDLRARESRLIAEQASLPVMNPTSEMQTFFSLFPTAQKIYEGQSELFVSRRENQEKQVQQIRERIAQIEIQIAGFIDQEDALLTQIALLREQVETQEKLLASGLTQRSQVLVLQRDLSQLEGRLAEVRSQKASNRAQIAELETQILGITTDYREMAVTELREVETALREQQEIYRNLQQRIGRLDIRAPAAGVIHNMQITSRESVLRPADVFLYIIPTNKNMIVNARLDSTHRDKIYTGQSARLQFPALDQNQTPEISASIMTISADVLQDDRTGMMYYDIQMAISPDELDRFPSHITLLPGMPVESFIQTSERSPLNYLLKPATDYLNKAMRED